MDIHFEGGTALVEFDLGIVPSRDFREHRTGRFEIQPGFWAPILMFPTKNCLQPWVVDKRQIKCRLIFAISHTSNIGLNTFLTRSHKINCLPALFFKYGHIRNERPYAESTHRFRFELSTRTGRSKDVRDLQ